MSKKAKRLQQLPKLPRGMGSFSRTSNGSIMYRKEIGEEGNKKRQFMEVLFKK